MGETRLEPLVLSEAERKTLENWAKRRKTAQGLALRARIVLACADGGPNIAVAARLGVSRGTVRKWRTRFLARRLDGLDDEPGRAANVHPSRAVTGPNHLVTPSKPSIRITPNPRVASATSLILIAGWLRRAAVSSVQRP